MSNDTSAEKPIDQWVTGDEPMTGPQRSYLETLTREAGEELRDDLTKAQASEEIDRLQQVTGRGTDSGQRSDEDGRGASGRGGTRFGANQGTDDAATSNRGNDDSDRDDGTGQESLMERIEHLERVVEQQAAALAEVPRD